MCCGGVYLQLLPLFCSVPLLPAVLRESFGALGKQGILLGDADATEGDLLPGLLEDLLLRHQPQQLLPQQQRFTGDFSSSSTSNSERNGLQCRLEEELWGSYFVLLDTGRSINSKKNSGSPWEDFDCDILVDNNSRSSSSSCCNEELQQRRQLLEVRPFLFLLYCALRQEAKRRGDLRICLSASWLMTDKRCAAGGSFLSAMLVLSCDISTRRRYLMHMLSWRAPEPVETGTPASVFLPVAPLCLSRANIYLSRPFLSLST